ncbi:SWIM zinc finger family protein [Deinococcus planocerae]|uniref:SWIM zinc finger family protein n=1 Tax=Deinococcus planocerae TaxID=1737569 RepID=UPI000C7E9396|nr:SWIM zinc finger family protein [Deinococcus planocerae]
MSLTPDELLRYAPGKVRERAQPLRGQVTHRERQGEVVRARVRGSRPAPYRVRINLQNGEVSCSCPDEYNAVCKHAAATLLALRDDPTSFLPGTPPRRLPKVDGWADADVERLLDRLHGLYPEVVTDWARQLTHEGEEEWS